jgi:hypothetical protein
MFFPKNVFPPKFFCLQKFIDGEYPRCDDVIDHTIYIYYYHINVDSTFLEDGLTDHDETFRDNRGWLPGANIHDAMTS